MDVCQHIIDKAWEAILKILKEKKKKAYAVIYFKNFALSELSHLCLQYWPLQGKFSRFDGIFSATYQLHSSCSRSRCEGTHGSPHSSTVWLCGSGGLLQTRALLPHDPQHSKQR